jgi:predicted transcriptional regulator
MIAFYPIKPIYSERIFSGEKTFELRKKLPNSDVAYILVYSTVPVGKVVGYAKVKALHRKSPSELWSMVAGRAGIREEDYKLYFDGAECACAIELENVKRFIRPFPVTEITGDFTIPQSFCYLDDAIFKRLKRRKVESV